MIIIMLVLPTPRNFAQLSCWYYVWYTIRKYIRGVAPSDMIFIPTFIEIRQLAQTL